MADKEKDGIIEELKRLKQENLELKEKIESLDSIIEEAASAIIIGDSHGKVLEANKKALSLTRYDHKEIENKNISEIIIKENIPESFSRKDPKEPSDEFTKEHILIRKDNKRLYVTVRTKLLPNKTYQLVIGDINKRKKAELALIESEKKYRLLVENVHDVIWTTTKNLKIVHITDSITNITDYSPDVYYVKPLHQLVTPISFQLIRDTLRKESEMIKTGTVSEKKHSSTIEIKLINKRNNDVWVELTSTAIKNQFGETAGFQGVLRNIDAEKRAKEILAKKAKRYDLALRSTSSGVWELNADLTKIAIDENLLDILGYSRDEIPPHLNEWVNITLKKDRRYIIDILQDILDGKKVTMSYQCRRVHKSGEILWFDDYVEAIVNNSGKITGLIGTSKNITKEKLLEEKKIKYYSGLQRLIDSTFHLLKLPEINNICDYAGKILLQNIPNSIIIFSLVNSETNEFKPTKFYGINEPKFNQMLKNISFIPNKTKIKLPNKEFNLLEKEVLIEYKGGFPEFISTVFPEEEAKKINDTFKFNNLHIIGISQNERLTNSISIISRERSNIENEEFIEAFINLTSIIINRKNIELELKELNATKNKFFSIISHDLKNPFNTFIGFSNLIIQNIASITKEKTLEFSKHIHDGALYSYNMMQNLFDWVNTQQGSLNIKPVEIKLPDLINELIKLFAGQASKKEIELMLKTTAEINLKTDKDVLSTILRNLFSNALKFTNTGGEVEVSYADNKDFIQFDVKDNGIGIPAEKQSQLFNMHTNESTKGTEEEKGTGLGLVLCKEFVDLLKGEIWIKSEVGKGTCISFTVPKNTKETP